MKDFNSTEKAIGNRLLKLRTEARMSQAEVADRADISVRTYADVERGEANMRVATLLAICSVLRVSPNDVLLEPDPAVEEARYSDIISDLDRSDERIKRVACRIIDALLHSDK